MKKLGEILLEKKIITKEQLDCAMQIQANTPGKYLGQILLDMGVPQLKLIKAIYYGNKRKSLGMILTEMNIITTEQLNQAIARQKSKANKFEKYAHLGNYLVEMGMITMEEYLNVLSIHFNMPVVSLKDFILSLEYQRVFGEQFTRDNRIIVLYNDQQVVRVALDEPNFMIIEELEKALPARKDILFYLVSPSEIEYCFDKEYDPYKLSRFR